MAQYSYKTISMQSVFDLSVQLYGDISKIGNLVRNFPNLDDNIEIGEVITLDVQTDPIAVYFKERGIKVATDIIDDTVPITVDNTDITVDTTEITSDQTIYL